MTLTRKQLSTLNTLVPCRLLNSCLHGPARAASLWRELLDAAASLGVLIAPIHGRACADAGHHTHDLVSDAEGEPIANSVLVHQVYVHQTGREEHTLYFS